MTPFRRICLPLVVSTTLALTSCSSDDGPPGGAGGPGGDCSTSGATPGAVTGEAAAVEASKSDVQAGVKAAQDFLATLDDSTRNSAMFDFADLDAKRCSWSNFPTAGFQGREGAKLGDLDEAQRQAAMGVLEALLSDAGVEQVRGIMAADDYLAAEGGQGGFGSDEYFLAFYGDPSADKPWTMQFGGHHLAVHVSVGADTISVTPNFVGVEPTTFTYEGTDYDPLADEAEAVFGLLGSLDDEQLAAAELSSSYDDLVMGPGVDTDYPEQEGVPYSDLTADQKAFVEQAIEAWVGDTKPALSQSLIDLYTSQLDETTIAYSGSTSGDEAAYFRVDGPRLWIEHLNAPNNDTEGIHYHTIYRDKAIDYGTGAE